MTRTGWRALLCGLVVLIGANLHADDTQEPVLRYARYRPTQTYYLYVPQAYEFSGTTKWPLFIAIHASMASGAGEFALWRQYADQEGFILLAPNLLPEAIGERSVDEASQTLVKIVEDVGRDYRIDWRRILLTGVAWGGDLAYRFAMAYPRFANTVAVLCPTELLADIRRANGQAPRFYFAVWSGQARAAQAAPAIVHELQKAGYWADLFVARGHGASVPSKAVVDVLELLRSMKVGA